MIITYKHSTHTHSKIRQLRGGILGQVVKGSVGPTLAGVRALLVFLFLVFFCTVSVLRIRTPKSI